ncbi:type I glyceraldehyde-3-phosphate dehydrogenase [Rubritalea profundi]|uniref:Glyceraldehyde-3-phosphate dehydrogenase n=1 Tax=Rubritalea profundi TaxID=1658618 RepID=A0A2S7TYR3_9BACT|nr:type I glyceraldehyde-3-phosphate dehydrogenase [Rubritalea profundi]PQJ27895.1 type I glyceraldehyde-3-phosphate dehydrogenase [Rubritalea profundi]
MANYAINGFGRIGRNVLRALIEKGELEKVVAINDLTDNKTLAHLLKYDSSQGKLDADVSFDEKHLIVNGHKIVALAQRDPAQLPWAELKVDVVLESTGFFASQAGSQKHIDAGAKKVLISAPAPDPDLMMCIGINDSEYDATKHNIVSNASCTTNCLAPMVKVLNDSFGLVQGMMATIHSYTNDQRILDLPHSDLRRSRAAAVNIIPTSTGAAKAIGKVIPELAGKLNGNSYRVPTPTGSITDLVCILKREVTLEEVNAAFKAAADGPLKGILEYTDEPIVLQDVVSNPHSSVYDSGCTMVDGAMVKLASWYDNEWGYSSRAAEGLALLGKGL